MDVNDYAYFLSNHVVLEFIASALAPTKVGVRLIEQHCGQCRGFFIFWIPQISVVFSGLLEKPVQYRLARRV